MTREFQFNHIQLGLTYPQANGLTKFELESFLLDWRYQLPSGVAISVEKYIIAMESHTPKDDDPIGGIHYHCYVRLTSKLRARDPFIFDCEDIMGKVYHPHIDKVRGFRNMVKYLTKEDKDPLANFNYLKSEDTPDFDSILARNFENAQSFLDFMINTYPKYTFGKYIQLKAIAYDRYETKIKEYVPKYTNFPNLPNAAHCWVERYLEADCERPLALIIIGATRTGKTEWARSLGRHMYFNGYFNLDIWDNEAKYAIFDDFDKEGKKLEEYFPQWKCWFGAQKEFTVTDKYRRKMSVKWGKPIIFISNNEIECNSKTLDYIKKNSMRINVYNDFY